MAQFTEIDGKKGVTSGLTRVYVDGMLLPVGSYADGQDDGPDPALWGVRAGLGWYLNPSQRNHPEYGRLEFFNMFPTMYVKMEAGLRGDEGWFFNMGAGLMVLRLLDRLWIPFRSPRSAGDPGRADPRGLLKKPNRIPHIPGRRKRGRFPVPGGTVSRTEGTWDWSKR